MNNRKLDADLIGNLKLFLSSLSIKDPSNPFNVKYRDLTGEEVQELISNINLLLDGEFSDLNIIEFSKLLKSLAEFQKNYGVSENNKYIEQAISHSLYKHVDKLLGFIDLPNLKQSALMLTLIGKIFQVDYTYPLDDLFNKIFAEKQLIIIDLLKSLDYSHVSIDFIKNVLPTLGSDNTNYLSSVLVSELLNYDNLFIIAELLASKNKKILGFGKNVLSEIISRKYNIDGPKFISFWLANSGRREDRKIHNIGKNLSMMRDLENLHKGSVLELYKQFGIVNFGRYSLSLLIDQYEQRDILDKDYGMVILTLEDHNAAFQTEDYLLDQFAKELKGRKLMRICEVINKRELAEQLIKVNRKYGEIDFAIIGGHGTQSSLALGFNVDWHRLEVNDIVEYIYEAESDYVRSEARSATKLREVAIKAARFLKKGATIVLVACDTGSGSDNLAKQLSRLGFKVIAPDESANLSDLGLMNGDPNKIYALYNRNANAKTYVNGVLIAE